MPARALVQETKTMFDFKNRHKSNWPEPPPREPTILEYIGGAFLIVAAFYGIFWLWLVQATGGFQ